MSTIKENDIGKTILINASFDMSGSTDLNIVFKQPDGTLVTKTASDGVTAPATPITVDVDGVETVFAANEYFSYDTEAGLLTPSGEWSLYGVYIDGTPKNFAGDVSLFTVVPRS